jgi:hypothetical protein
MNIKKYVALAADVKALQFMADLIKIIANVIWRCPFLALGNMQYNSNFL